jgi:4-amino-4-deoxy-L-arabinose transferase-like glycosyltransferase
MNWLPSLDSAVFRWVNQSLAHPWLDWLMPVLSGNALFTPALVLLAVVLLWKGGVRGRLCVLMLVLVVGALNNAVVDALKHAFDRHRPFVDLPDVRLLVGRGKSSSLPSSHAANWLAAATVAWVYYRRSLGVLLPLGLLVGVSRVYNGVHYPSDVLAGFAVGVAVGAGGVWLVDGLWRWLGARWFPLWWRRLPSLTHPVVFADPLAPRPGIEPIRDPVRVRERQWLHLGYVVIAVLLFARLAYLRSETIEISKDEAYQWLWSKHLALSYFSKPPFIAYFQWIGTHLWGDTPFGIRFFAPVITSLASLLVLRFLAREVNTRAAFALILVVTATPLLALGSILFTIDAPSVLFWTAAMLAGWRAVQREGRTRDWLWTGLWLGMGFLSKYTALLQWVSLGVFWVIWPPARRHLRRPGPYLALTINALCTLPVLIWNAQHDWITVTHLEDRAGLDEAWRPTLRFFFEYTGAQFALLNPVFCLGALWAAVAVWRRRRQDPLLLFAFAMGVPLILGYWLYSLRARVQPNWIAPAVLPLLLLMVVYAEARWRAGVRAIRTWLTVGLAFGLPLILLMHDSNLVTKATGRALPPRVDPCRRVRGWTEGAAVLGELRREFLREGKPVFIIGEHYGVASLLSFYLPEAKAAVRSEPLAYCVSSDQPRNQFYFWPGYATRQGQNAIYVMEVSAPEPPPARLVREFKSVEDLGVREIRYRGRVLRKLQFIACRELR